MVRTFAAVTALATFVGVFAAHADVEVSTSINASNIQLSASGFQVVYSLSDAAFATAEDSLGGFNFGYDSTPDDPASTGTVATALANSSATASANGLSAGATGGISIPGQLDATADTYVDGGSNGTLSGTFEFVDPSNPSATEAVSTTLVASALVGYTQNLFTDQYGLQAYSEVQFQLSLDPLVDSTGPLLYLDNPITIGSSTTQNVSFGTQTLTNSISVTGLQTNYAYSLTIEADAETSGINTAAPEPGYLILLAAGLTSLFVLRSRRQFGV